MTILGTNWALMSVSKLNKRQNWLSKIQAVCLLETIQKMNLPPMLHPSLTTSSKLCKKRNTNSTLLNKLLQRPLKVLNPQKLLAEISQLQTVRHWCFSILVSVRKVRLCKVPKTDTNSLTNKSIFRKIIPIKSGQNWPMQLTKLIRDFTTIELDRYLKLQKKFNNHKNLLETSLSLNWGK